MAYFDWKDEYNVNIVQIDSQHKKLVELLNQLFDAMQAGKGKDILGKILADLIDYTRIHFQAEEKLLQSKGYPGYSEHCQEHARFTQQVEDFQAQYASGRVTLSVQISGFLKNWLSNHILKTDQLYSPFLIAQGVR